MKEKKDLEKNTFETVSGEDKVSGGGGKEGGQIVVIGPEPPKPQPHIEIDTNRNCRDCNSSNYTRVEIMSKFYEYTCNDCGCVYTLPF